MSRPALRCALDPITLETKGFPAGRQGLSRGIREPVDEDDGNMAPHPKWDADTGMLYAWGYSDVPPVRHASLDQARRHMPSRALLDAPYNTVAHDAWLSENYFILPFQPFTISSEKANKGLGGYGWEVDKPIMLALINRFDINSEILWITADFPPQYMMHMLSANEIGDKILLDAPLFGRPPFQTDEMSAPGDPFIPFFQVAPSKLAMDHRPQTRTVTSEVLDDVMCELPKIDERLLRPTLRLGCSRRRLAERQPARRDADGHADPPQHAQWARTSE